MDSAKVMEYTAEVCRKSGADEWEIASIESRLLSVEAKDGGVEAFEVASSLGIAVRVRVGDRPGFSYSAECSDNALSLMVDSAMAGARAADADPQSAFADPGGILPDLNLWDSAFENIGKDQKIARAFAIEEEARKYDRRIARVRSAVYGEGSRLIRIINSHGLNREARANGCSASLMAVAEENGESQMGWDHAYSGTWDELDVRAIARSAAADAVDMLGAKTIPTVKAPVILRHSTAAELLAVLGNSFLGESVAKGKSMLIGKLGKKIFSELITIYDDGLMKNGAASFPFDGEGVPRHTTRLACNGAIEHFLYDLPWGRRAGKESTGNAIRGGYISPPMLGLTNLYIPAGDRTLEEIIKETGKGLLVKELMGVHTANPISGDFSLGVSGTWIEGGGPAYPVQGVTVAGNIIELFGCVDAVAADLKFVDRVGSPSLRIDCLSIGGQ